MDQNTTSPNQLTHLQFKRRFLILILSTWTIPAVFGLSYLVYIQMFTLQQMLSIMSHPLEPLYVILSTIFTLWYFNRYAQPLIAHLTDPESIPTETLLQHVRRFPLDYWAIFIIYLLIAPVTVIYSAELYTDFVAQPIDWLRINLVALIVSIIVGLPLFFLILDLFGKALSDVPLPRPHVTIKAKVFLIGALVPLLIDTMLVQYFWTRTGFFSVETFIIWLSLEMLAIVGSLIFVRSFGQSLAPLQKAIELSSSTDQSTVALLSPQSTDELGVLVTKYRSLLEEHNTYIETLRISNQILRDTGESSSLKEVFSVILRLCQQSVGGDTIFLLLKDKQKNELVAVTQTGMEYNPEGYYRLSLDETSMAVFVFNQGETTDITDVETDPRVSQKIRKRFGIKAALATPLRVEGEVIGVLMSVNTKQRYQYNQKEILLIEGFAREAALALHTQTLRLQRTQAERESSEKDALFKALINNTSAMVFIKDLDGHYLLVNGVLEGLLNIKASAIIGKTDYDFFPKAVADTFHANDLKMIASGVPTEFEEIFEFQHIRRTYMTNKFPLFKNDGTCYAICGISTDITKLKQNEQKIKESEHELALIINNMQDTYYRTNLNGELTRASPSVNSLLGYKVEEILGTKMADLYVDSQGREQFLAKLQETNGRVLAYEAPLLHKDGSHVWVSTNAHYCYDDQGTISGIEGTTRDVTRLKAAEAELKTHQERLEELVAQRTAGLEASNRELESFSYSVSHDLRSPLRSIDGFSMVLLEDYGPKLDDEGRDYLRRVRQASQRMGDLIDDLLMLSRVARLGFKLEKISLSDLVEDIMEDLRQQAPMRKVEAIIQADVDARGDSNLIRIALENLLSNAWKYTSKNAVAKIEFGVKIQDGQKVYCICDNGVGFNMKYSDKLFGAFERLHRTDEFEGTGIGLATVQRIIQRHGGTIWAEAEIGKGAAFYFTMS